ncbi:hypothetical protein QU755_11275 [Pseudomonas wenzhouensis]|nr:hypothetical protein [Pseudomonas wenzhouensis]MDM9652054.1 hypothetical protein [Pseudomonas wenzhouensis]
MSMPVLTYGCTRCELRGWSSQTWGYRYYSVDGQRLRMRSAMGWCHACGQIVAVERRPDLPAEQSLQLELSTLREQLANVPPVQKGRRRWWFGPVSKTPEQRALEASITSVERELSEIRLLLSLMGDRQESDRCLSCGSQACFHLPAAPVAASFDFYSESPQSLACEHPGCGGLFTVCNEGVRFSIRPASRAYDLRGMPLGPWYDM